MKRATLFTLKYTDDDGVEVREAECRACNREGLTYKDRHKILREAYRNYLTYKYLVTTGEDGVEDVIEYAVPREPGSDEWVPITISYTDLSVALKKFSDGSRADGTVLSKRKEQAFTLNVLYDQLQRDVAETMGITTVSVGQYVEQAMLQLCEYYFGEDEKQPVENRKAIITVKKQRTDDGTLKTDEPGEE